MNLSSTIQQKNIRVSLVITTYNSPIFLELVLKSVLKQRVFPSEVVIADDGSTDETRLLIDNYRKSFPVPLVHSWIPDRGFRVAKARNVAIAKAQGDYIILIDGDMLLTPHFVEDHIRLMKAGRFVTGSRARLKEKATAQRCANRNADIHIASYGLSRRLVLLRIPWMHNFIRGHRGLRNARSCHMAFWKNDYVKVNGFEEAFEGWGYEDSEFVQRLYNNGLERKNAKLLAPAIHLYHAEKSTERAEANLDMLNGTINSKKLRADRGVDQYLIEN